MACAPLQIHAGLGCAPEMPAAQGCLARAWVASGAAMRTTCPLYSQRYRFSEVGAESQCQSLSCMRRDAVRSISAACCMARRAAASPPRLLHASCAVHACNTCMLHMTMAARAAAQYTLLVHVVLYILHASTRRAARKRARYSCAAAVCMYAKYVVARARRRRAAAAHTCRYADRGRGGEGRTARTITYM